MIVFFDIKRIVHHKFMPQGQTVSKHFYSNVLQHLKEDKLPVKNNMNAVPHSTCSPDLAPCDFMPFPHPKRTEAVIDGEERFDKIITL
jgi:hypothetical protein